LTFLDLTQGYHQVKIADNEVYKTAFSITECGSYEYLREHKVANNMTLLQYQRQISVKWGYIFQSQG
jgi:hypothetical protein